MLLFWGMYMIVFQFLFPLNFWAKDLTLSVVNLLREQSFWLEKIAKLLYSAFTFLGVCLLKLRAFM